VILVKIKMPATTSF